MSRVVTWLQHHEKRMFCFVNQRIQHDVLDLFFNAFTISEARRVMIVTALSIALFTGGDWRTAGIQSCAALAVSHLPVAIIKKNTPDCALISSFPIPAPAKIR
ncbi:hypothetical protein [Paenibacillus validus]|uniref:hypothetical protein n=1 Tax=Paenibacillus validus TaxID=44253 RepID=UPI003D2B490D